MVHESLKVLKAWKERRKREKELEMGGRNFVFIFQELFAKIFSILSVWKI